MYASVALPQFRSILMGAFALMALLLAAIGIYSVMTYSVLQSTQELAIRLALGATRGNVIGRVVAHGIFLALCGITIGSVGDLGFVRTLRSMLFNVSPSDPTPFLALRFFFLPSPSPLVTSPHSARHARILYERCVLNELTVCQAN
jgi:putative ABC transport system permease protein